VSEAWAVRQLELLDAEEHLAHIDAMHQLAGRRVAEAMRRAVFMASLVEGATVPSALLDRELEALHGYVKRLTQTGPPWSAASRQETAEAIRLLMTEGLRDVPALKAQIDELRARRIAAVEQAIDVAVLRAIEAVPPEQRPSPEEYIVTRPDPRDVVEPELTQLAALLDELVAGVETTIQALTAPSPLPEIVATFEQALRAKVADQLQLRERLRVARALRGM
jgi:hypothetical protein